MISIRIPYYSSILPLSLTNQTIKEIGTFAFENIFFIVFIFNFHFLKVVFIFCFVQIQKTCLVLLCVFIFNFFVFLITPCVPLPSHLVPPDSLLHCLPVVENMTVPPTRFWARVYSHLNDVDVLSNTFNVLKSVIETIKRFRENVGLVRAW